VEFYGRMDLSRRRNREAKFRMRFERPSSFSCSLGVGLFENGSVLADFNGTSILCFGLVFCSESSVGEK
jgi:hypothetical protein